MSKEIYCVPCGAYYKESDRVDVIYSGGCPYCAERQKERVKAIRKEAKRKADRFVLSGELTKKDAGEAEKTENRRKTRKGIRDILDKIEDDKGDEYGY